MKTLSVKDLSTHGASRAIREEEDQPGLTTINNEPAVWMLSAQDMAQAAAAIGGAPDLYPTAVRVLAVKLFDDNVLSLGRAAEQAGLPLTDFMDLCGTLQMLVYRTPPQGLDAEVTAFDAWVLAGARAQPEPDSGE